MIQSMFQDVHKTFISNIISIGGKRQLNLRMPTPLKMRRTKPINKQQLINTIVQFWGTVDKAKCNKHLNKVIPKIIEMEGAATGY